MRSVDVPSWLSGMPMAPEFRPTDTEFADPIAYISKIEKEASNFGICKIIPPLSRPSKRYVFCNLNKSLSKSPELFSDDNLSRTSVLSKIDNVGKVKAVFTTRHQELGHCQKKARVLDHQNPSDAHMQVWQSGEVYTLEQFECKSKAFSRDILGVVKDVSPLAIETMFWKSAYEKSIYVEYANDVPGSGFGEPMGQFQSVRKRRGRHFKKNCETKAYFIDHNKGVDKDTCLKINKTSNSELFKALYTPSEMAQEDHSIDKRSESLEGDGEGTAGWKLSNSPWNLQLISRSPGSLTRFMPGDIPGVTSPMIYIAMLFSWFAWHVEDHELHSLNFLHTGSSKTWYAVPGDHALSFEGIIHKHVYGGKLDKLGAPISQYRLQLLCQVALLLFSAVLGLLGQKTTLLSPEVFVSSGIPCCRLVQNPGEFVVTFPRAYHVGFSHGFSCGEAANFGTSQWLKVAKEAAIRRVAMNYLPMLSHQQLLYLLTMSFVLGVPRSLIPGARNSRLRYRMREERELLVKKAFIADLLNETNLVHVILRRQKNYHAVLWNLESLSGNGRESLDQDHDTSSTLTEKHAHSNLEKSLGDCKFENGNYMYDASDEMMLNMDTVNDLYAYDDSRDDICCEFQIDSGTLPCVSCGVLGFPFMSILQPSGEKSSYISEKHSSSGDCSGVSKSFESFGKHTEPGDGVFAAGEHNALRTGVIENDMSNNIKLDQNNENGFLPFPRLSLTPVSPLSLENVPDTSIPDGSSEWNPSSRYMRPHLFCLEHAIQVQHLLLSKGGANVLIICHSDYQKMKSSVRLIADEVGGRVPRNEPPLINPSREDINLINLAVDSLQKTGPDPDEDWTSAMGVNLHHAAKLTKSSPSHRLDLYLPLADLLPGRPPPPPHTLRWLSRGARSVRRNAPENHSVEKKPVLIHYSRRCGRSSTPAFVMEKTKPVSPKTEPGEEEMRGGVVDVYYRRRPGKRVREGFVRGPCEGLRRRGDRNPTAGSNKVGRKQEKA